MIVNILKLLKNLAGCRAGFRGAERAGVQRPLKKRVPRKIFSSVPYLQGLKLILY